MEWRARRGRVFPRTRGRKGVVYLYLMYARMRLAVADLTITVSPSTSRIQRGPLVAIGATQGQGLGSPPPPWPGLRRLNLLHATVHLVLCSAAPAALAGVTTSSNRDRNRVRLSSVAFSIRAPLPLLCAPGHSVRIGSSLFAACRARLLLSPNVIRFGSSAEHAPSRVTSHTINPLRSARHGFLRLRRQPAPGSRSSDQCPRLRPARRLCRLQWRGSR